MGALTPSEFDHAEEKVQSNHESKQEELTQKQHVKLKAIIKKNKQERLNKITQTLEYAHSVIDELNEVERVVKGDEFNDKNLLNELLILYQLLEGGSDRNNPAYEYIKLKISELLLDVEGRIENKKEIDNVILDNTLKERLKKYILLDWKYKVLMNALVFIENNAKKQKKIFKNLNLLRVGIEKLNARYEYQEEVFKLIMSFWDNIEIKSDGNILIKNQEVLEEFKGSFENKFKDIVSKIRKDDNLIPLGFASLVGGGTTFFLINMGAISGPVSIVICATLFGIGAIDFLHKFFAKSYNFINHYQITKSEGYQNITKAIGNMNKYGSEHRQEVESESVSEAQKNRQFDAHGNISKLKRSKSFCDFFREFQCRDHEVILRRSDRSHSL